MRGKGPGFHLLYKKLKFRYHKACSDIAKPAQISQSLLRYCKSCSGIGKACSGIGKACHNQTLRAVARGYAGRHTLEGRLRGAFSGGEIQRLRRLRQEGHSPQSRPLSHFPHPTHSPQSRPLNHTSPGKPESSGNPAFHKEVSKWN